MNNKLVGEKLIKAAISLDESLVEILKVEVKRLKQLTKNDINLEELKKTNKLIKNIILALMITDEKVRTGINLCMDNNEINNP